MGLLACFAIAMHAILFGASMQPAGAAVDPFSIICHSGPVSASDQAPADQTPSNQTPSKACDHCSLCFVASAAIGPDTIVAGTLAPPSVLQVLTPASSVARAYSAGTPHLARGPPQRA